MLLDLIGYELFTINQPRRVSNLFVHEADILHVPVLGPPIANYDNNQHGPNENIRLRNLWDGINAFAALLSGLGRNW